MKHEGWLLTPERVAVHLASGTAVIADVHLGYHLTRRMAGDAVPLVSLEEQMRPLAKARARGGFDRLVIAGDLVERTATRELVDEFRAWLRGEGIELTAVVPGNHDRRLVGFDLPMFDGGYLLDGWRVVHGHEETEGRVVCGHWHPCVLRERRKRPCYLTSPERLVLPAFCREAAGSYVDRRRWGGYRCWVVSGEAVRDGGVIA